MKRRLGSLEARQWVLALVGCGLLTYAVVIHDGNISPTLAATLASMMGIGVVVPAIKKRFDDDDS